MTPSPCCACPRRGTRCPHRELRMSADHIGRRSFRYVCVLPVRRYEQEQAARRRERAERAARERLLRQVLNAHECATRRIVEKVRR